MSTASSSGREGPTPISVRSDGSHDREQVRASFRYGPWFLSLGDRVTGYHRERQLSVTGILTLMAGCLCVSSSAGTFPLQKLAIHEVAPPTLEAA